MPSKRTLVSEISFGIGASAVAFLASLILTMIVGESHFALAAAAIALVCWRRGWRAGVAAAASGLIAVALLLPPVLTLRVDSAGDVFRLLTFAVTSSLVCGLAYAVDRSNHRLSAVEQKWRESQHWLRTAQQFTRFWTWELDPERKVLKWANPYGALRSQEYEPLESWLRNVHPEDRERCRSALQEAAGSGSLMLEFRLGEAPDERRVVSKGVAIDAGARGTRFLGVSVQLDAGTGALDHEPAGADLHGIDELLTALTRNPSLDWNARTNVVLAHHVVERLLIANAKKLPAT